jgi:hypothetical protein
MNEHHNILSNINHLHIKGSGGFAQNMFHDFAVFVN